MSTLQTTLMRVLLGVYLVQHFVLLVPYASELFSGQGVIADPRLVPSYGLFPNPFFLPLSAVNVAVLVAILGLAAAAFAWGWRVRLMALVLWFFWAALLSRSPFIANPSIPFIGLMLLCFAATPKGQPIARLLWNGVWVIMALSYTVSGIHKLGSPSWADGSAIRELVHNPLARDYWFTWLVASSPAFVTVVMTYGALALEILFAPLAIIPRIRPWIWLGMVAMHVGIVMMVSFADLTLGMLLLHLFTFDERWIRPRPSNKGVLGIVFVDGDCAFCSQAAQTVIDNDRDGLFQIAAIQGDTAKTILPAERRERVDTVVLYDTQSEQLFTQTDALMRIGVGLGGLCAVAAHGLRLLPRSLRDLGYRLFARNRYRVSRMFRVAHCALPDQTTRGRYLP